MKSSSHKVYISFRSSSSKDMVNINACCLHAAQSHRDQKPIMLQHSHLKYLHIVDFAYLLYYNQPLTTRLEGSLFGSVIRALVLNRGVPGTIPSQGLGKIISYALHLLGDGGSSNLRQGNTR